MAKCLIVGILWIAQRLSRMEGGPIAVRYQSTPSEMARWHFRSWHVF
jgi:hypothetical protein